MDSINFPMITIPLPVISFINSNSKNVFLEGRKIRLEKGKKEIKNVQLETIQQSLGGGGEGGWRQSLIRSSGEWLKRHRSLGVRLVPPLFHLP